MTEDELIEEYGYWGEHPDYPVVNWQSEVVSGDTRAGYWQWVLALADEDEL